LQIIASATSSRASRRHRPLVLSAANASFM
jgi:hypothetical protein